MNTFKELNTQLLNNCEVRQPVAKVELTLADPVKNIVTDFGSYNPLRLKAMVGIDDALGAIKNAATSFSLVMNDKDQLAGIISAADLQSAKVLSLAHQQGLSRKDLTVEDMMTPISKAHGVSQHYMDHASVGDTLHTMEKRGVMFLLVLSTADNQICGLISAREISRRLNIPLHISPIASGFHEVMLSVDHPH